MKKSIFTIFLFVLIVFLLIPDGVPLSKIKERIEKTGRLKFKGSVDINYLSGAMFRTYIEHYYNKIHPVGLSEKEEFFLRTMGFYYSNKTLDEIRKNVIKNNAGGFYDEKTKKLFVISDHINSDPVYLLVLVHELRHVIQDQYFDLSEMEGELSDFDDRKLAVIAALEGDAMLLMSKYAEKHTPFPVSPELSDSGYNSDALLSFSPIKFSYNLGELPPVIKYHLTMPYMWGLKFTFEAYKKKKWKSVNKILSNLPESTEQILHPKKYFKREKPIRTKIGYVPQGYKVSHSGTIGEYMLNILLMQDDDYKDYASGWGGDTFKMYRKKGNYFFVWESVWDKEEYCSRFYTDYRNFLETGFSVSFKEGNVKGNPFVAGRIDGHFYFLRKLGKSLFYVKTNDRKEINNFINGGYYD